jgi:hypothetical protein
MINIATNPTANNIGVENLIDPPHMVPIQLKIFTPVGTAMNIVERAKAELATGPNPVVNMWWAQTPHPMNPMAAPANTIAAYPKIGFRLNVGSTSETIPIAGKIMM